LKTYTPKAAAVSCIVPIRRSRWPSFWIGAGAVFVSLLVAAGAAAALLLTNLDGALLVIVFAVVWFGLFFFSYPLQRRLARSLDLRRPCVSLDNDILAVPVAEDSALRFNLAEPHELTFGWWEFVVKSTGGPTTNTRTVLTHATLTQSGQPLFLKAEDSMREALAAGWPKSPPNSEPHAAPGIRLWASDLVALVEAMRA
jgi:hypothetical protein